MRSKILLGILSANSRVKTTLLDILSGTTDWIHYFLTQTGVDARRLCREAALGVCAKVRILWFERCVCCAAG